MCKCNQQHVFWSMFNKKELPCRSFCRTLMGNSYAGQLRSARFEEVLHNSIEASLRSNTLVPRPVFSQLYLETEQSFGQSELSEIKLVDSSSVWIANFNLGFQDHSTFKFSFLFFAGRAENEDEDDEDGSESNSPPIPYQMKPPPEGCCTTDGPYDGVWKLFNTRALASVFILF